MLSVRCHSAQKAVRITRKDEGHKGAAAGHAVVQNSERHLCGGGMHGAFRGLTGVSMESGGGVLRRNVVL